MDSALVKHPHKFREMPRTRKSDRLRGTGTFQPGCRKVPAGWLLAGILALLLIFPLSASAHSPSDVQLSYLEQEQTLQVTITHNSYLPNSHYVKRVEIRKNSEKPLVQEYTNQPDRTTFVYRYKLPLKEGDRVEVIANCSLYGSRSARLVISGPAAK